MKAKVISRQKIGATQIPKENIVDRAFLLDAEIKKLSAELKTMKKEIKREAELKQVHELPGLYATATITDTQSWDIDVEKMIEWLKKNKKTDLTSILLKPSVTDLVKYLGELSIKDFGKLDTKEYNKLTFKAKR